MPSMPKHISIKKLSFCLLFGAIIYFPVAGMEFCRDLHESCRTLGWVANAVFPLQIFFTILFFFDFLGRHDFWIAYIVYLIFIGSIAAVFVKAHVRITYRFVILYFIMCTGIYFANEVLLRMQIADFVHALPAKPAVQ